MPPPDGAAHELHDVGLGAERTHELLQQVLQRLDRIEAKLGERERLPASRLHLNKGSELANEIAQAIGDVAFDARELLDHAVRSDRQLLAAIVAAVGHPDAGATRRIGKLLAQVDGVNLPSGYRVERIDDNAAAGASWRVVRV